MRNALILLTVCLLALSACSEYQGEDCTKKDPKAIFDSPDMCWSLKAQKTSTIDMCDKITKLNRRTVCIGSVAGKLNDYYLCRDLNTEKAIKTLYPEIYDVRGTNLNEQQRKSAEEQNAKQLKEASRSSTRHCIYLHYNEVEGTGSKTPPDTYLEYGTYTKEEFYK